MNDDKIKKDADKELNEEADAQVEQDDVVFDDEAELGPAEIIKKLRSKLKTAVEEKQAYLNNWQRDKAEFVNARKRDEEAKTEFLKFSKQGIVEEILPVLDSFDMAILHGNKDNSPKWLEGFEGIYNQLLGILSKHGVSQFGASGDAFDPNLHHSIGMTKTENKADDHKVADVAQRGYMMAGKVIRPALVRVWEV